MYKVVPFQLSETHVVRYVVVLVSKSACVCVLGCCRSTLPLVTVCALGQKLKQEHAIFTTVQVLRIADLSGSHK